MPHRVLRAGRNTATDYPDEDYESITASVSYLLKTNLRLTGEVTQDMERESTRVVAGFMAGF